MKHLFFRSVFVGLWLDIECALLRSPSQVNHAFGGAVRTATPYFDVTQLRHTSFLSGAEVDPPEKLAPYGPIGCKEIDDDSMVFNVADPGPPIKFEEPGMTIEKCYDVCNPEATIYFAIRQAKVCYCYDAYQFEKVADTNCNIPCPSNETQICGGDPAWSVYEMWAWIPPPPQIPCGAPNPIANAARMCSEGGPGKLRNCEVVCKIGFRLAMNTLFCDTNIGSWIGTAACAEVSCGPPPEIPNALRACSTASPGRNDGACDVKCAPGFSIEENTLKCTMPPNDQIAEGFYEGQAICSSAKCGVPPPRDNALAISAEVSFPGKVVYTCQEGFSISGDAGAATTYEILCTDDGTFTQAVETCSAVQCKGVPVPKHSVRIPGPNQAVVSATVHFPEQAAYRCMEGFSIDGTGAGATQFSIACQATGEFDVVPDCLPRECGLAPQLPNAHMDGESTRIYTFQEQATYTCDEGHALSENPADEKAFSLVCSATGEFLGDIQQCVPVTCGMPPEVEHALAPEGKVIFPNKVEYSCELGYTVDSAPTGPSSFSLDCAGEGNFAANTQIASTPQCLPVSCGAPPTIGNASLTAEAKRMIESGVHQPTILEFQCDDGFSIGGTALDGAVKGTLQCLPSGHYSDPLPCINIDDCIGHDCGPYGHCVDLINNFTCACESGYEATVQEGELSCGNINDCGPEACGEGGTCQDLVNDYSCLCDEGFQLVTTDTEKTCERVMCGDAPHIENAHVPNIKAVFADIVEYTCHAGFTLDGTATGETGHSIACQSNAAFSEFQPCLPVKCGVPTIVEHARAPGSPAAFPNSLRYSCETGHTTNGAVDGPKSFEVECLATGEYSEMPECLPVSCGPPPGVDMAVVAAEPLTYSQNVTYECQAGYSTSPANPSANSFTVKCEVDGSISGISTCLPVKCDLPFDLASNTLRPIIIGQGHTSSDPPSFANFPDEIEYACKPGFSLTGVANGSTSFVQKCTEAGNLTGGAEGTAGTVELECKPVRCGRVPDVPNAFINGTAGSELTFGQTVGIQCAPGFAIEAALSENDATAAVSPSSVAGYGFAIECLETGDFSPLEICKNIDDCVGKTCGPHGSCVDDVEDYRCECESGFEVTVKDNGERWCGNIDDCGPGACGPHGHCIDFINSYTCECVAGYETLALPANDTICEAITCQALPTLANAHIQDIHASRFVQIDDGNLFSDKFGYHASCEGYSNCYFSTYLDAKHFCIEAGEACTGINFYPKDGQCNASATKGCYAPAFGDLIPNFAITDAGGTTFRKEPTMNLSFSQSIDVQCLPGYSFTGLTNPEDATAHIDCLPDGSLTTFSACRPISCGYAPAVQNIKDAPDPTKEFVFGDTALYTCMDGFTLDGTSMGAKAVELGCPQDGMWGAPMHCQPVHCGAPPSIKDGNVEQFEIVYPGEVVYQCDLGHTLDVFDSSKTSFVRKCLASGEFDAIPDGVTAEDGKVRCHRKSCGEPPNVTHASHTPGLRSFGDHVTYDCKQGYTIDGTDAGLQSWSVYCAESGQFTASDVSAESCQQITFKIEGRVSEATNMNELPGAKVTLMRSDGSFKETAISNEMGVYTAEGVPEGQLTLKVAKKGYVTKEKLITLQDHVMSGETADLALTPKLPDDAYQIKLSWDEPTGGPYTLAYKKQMCKGIPLSMEHGHDPTGVLASKELCESSCTDNPDCLFYVYKDCPECKRRYACGTYSSCDKRKPSSKDSIIYQKKRAPDIDSVLEFGDRMACKIDWSATNMQCNGIHSVLEMDDAHPYREVTTILDTTKACRNKKEGECLMKFSANNFGASPSFAATGSLIEIFHGKKLIASFRIGDAIAGKDAGVVTKQKDVGSGEKWEVFFLDGKTGEITPFGKVDTCFPKPAFTVKYSPIAKGPGKGNYWCNDKITSEGGKEAVGQFASPEACACECQKNGKCKFFLYKYDPKERNPYRCATYAGCDAPKWDKGLRSSTVYEMKH